MGTETQILQELHLQELKVSSISLSKQEDGVTERSQAALNGRAQSDPLELASP